MTHHFKYPIHSVLSLILYHHLIQNTLTQTIQSGNTFSASTSSQYRDYVLNCTDNDDCAVTCSSTYSCYNTTILCPADNACSVSCSSSVGSCIFTNIHWIQGNTNSLSLATNSSNDVLNVKYPPTISDNTALTVSCDESYKCYGLIINCPNNAECQILCSESNSCNYIKINCPQTSTCNVVCTGTTSCYRALVYWSYHESSTSTLACPNGGNQCDLIQAPKIINPPDNHSLYNLICDESKECASSTINCPTNGKCIINCLAYGSCSGSIINCPLNKDCDIICHADYACYGAIFNGPMNQTGVISVLCDNDMACAETSIYAENSEYFFFTIPTENNGIDIAQNTSIWFPPKIGNQTRSTLFVNGRDFHGNYGYESQNFYAINGWEDVHIISDDYFSYQGGTMYCGGIHGNYTKSCPFASNGWNCSVVNTICDSIITNPPTNEPTSQPSHHPTINPSTNPTNDPTTTSQPTIDPTTKSPTIDPTEMPIRMLGPNETYTPTLSPLPTTATPTTMDPTFVPSSDPTIQPSTFDPTTAYPTTDGPTTADPTTALPTTASPTTNEPTFSPSIPDTSPLTKEMVLSCIYEDDLTEISKHLSFKDYGSIMTESMIYSAELILLLPIWYETTSINQYASWERAGISQFTFCTMFDVTLIDSCPVNITNIDTNDHSAVATFEIVAYKEINAYRNKLMEIFQSDLFLEIFSEQMNLQLTNYTKRRRLSSYNGFTAYQIDVIDPLSAPTYQPTVNPTIFESTPGPTIVMSKEYTTEIVDDAITVIEQGTDHSTEFIAVIVILCIFMFILIIGFVWLYKYKSSKTEKSKEIVKRVVELEGRQPGGQVPDPPAAYDDVNEVVVNSEKKEESKETEDTSGMYDNEDDSKEKPNEGPKLTGVDDKDDNKDQSLDNFNPFEDDFNIVGAINGTPNINSALD